jgi:hypothetical protein
LTEIHCKNPTPPSIDSYCFSNVNKTTCKLYIPKGSYFAYWLSNWGDFENIIEEDVSAIYPISKDNISINTLSNGLSIETKETIAVAVYAVSGQRVYQSVINGKREIHLNKGVYLIKAGNETKKIIVP